MSAHNTHITTVIYERKHHSIHQTIRRLTSKQTRNRQLSVESKERIGVHYGIHIAPFWYYGFIECVLGGQFTNTEAIINVFFSHVSPAKSQIQIYFEPTPPRSNALKIRTNHLCSEAESSNYTRKSFPVSYVTDANSKNARLAAFCWEQSAYPSFKTICWTVLTLATVCS
jgi:hypothetical protein